MEVQNTAETCADRCLAEAVAQWQVGEVRNAAALFRACARYLERLGEESGDTGVVITLPSPALAVRGARFAGALGEGLDMRSPGFRVHPRERSGARDHSLALIDAPAQLGVGARECAAPQLSADRSPDFSASKMLDRESDRRETCGARARPEAGRDPAQLCGPQHVKHLTRPGEEPHGEAPRVIADGLQRAVFSLAAQHTPIETLDAAFLAPRRKPLHLCRRACRPPRPRRTARPAATP
jgi:hypothetical protein